MTEKAQLATIFSILTIVSIYLFTDMDKNFSNSGNNNQNGIQSVIENSSFEQKSIKELQDDGTINNTYVDVK